MEKMENKNKPAKVRWNIVRAFLNINHKTKHSSLDFKRDTEFITAMNRIKKLYSIDDIQAIILGAALDYEFENTDEMQFSDLSRFFEVETLAVAGWVKDFRTLENKKLISYYESENKIKISGEVVKSIIDNRAPSFSDATKKTVPAFLKDFINTARENFWESLSLCGKQKSLIVMEQKNSDLDFVSKCKNLIPDMNDRFVFYSICLNFHVGNKNDLDTILEYIIPSDDQMVIGREMLTGRNNLITKKLVKIDRQGMYNDATFTLNKGGLQLLYGEDAKYYLPQIDNKLLIASSSIKDKRLFYSADNQKQIDMLKSALSQDRFVEIQERLKEKGMVSGMAILLYGAPGTGKTESVLQIARETGRDIIHVNISETKSSWFGESEKKIKSIFDNYKALCEMNMENGKAPILLFNEADAIFARRHVSDFSSCDQTENAMQNIILEEMENFEGILIATTNLADNLDAAFERRFLFKIKFDKPTVEAKSKIWQSKLRWLNESDADCLAQAYDFSGGEIDNVVRKAMMNQVITGVCPRFEEIQDICKTERIYTDSKNSIGFTF